jgi:hypothetical protein
LQSDGAAVPRLCSRPKATEILIHADLGVSSVRFDSFRSGYIGNLLTYSMEQSPSCEANRFSPSQDIGNTYPYIFREIGNLSPYMLWEKKASLCTLWEIGNISLYAEGNWKYISLYAKINVKFPVLINVYLII